jgi:tetratricopeptide (TPR) repeat protein
LIDFFREGFWIPFVLFGAACLYALWIVYRKLDVLRDRSHRLSGDLGSVLIQSRIAHEAIHNAASRIETGEVDQAIQELEKLKNDHPDLPIAVFYLGKAYLAKGETNLAKEFFREFIEQTRPYDSKSKERLEEAKGYIEDVERA